ncbi:MAG: hypothetical protein ACP5RI_01730 [Candidatus Micrarchaeia archaeon]
MEISRNAKKGKKECNRYNRNINGFMGSMKKAEILFVLLFLTVLKVSFASSYNINANASTNPLYFQVMPLLSNVKSMLAQIGPALSAMLFIVAGIFYAFGQLLPPEKKAQFHTTAINVIIGAIVIAALSFASTSLATASTQLLSNFTSNAVNTTIH